MKHYHFDAASTVCYLGAVYIIRQRDRRLSSLAVITEVGRRTKRAKDGHTELLQHMRPNASTYASFCRLA